MGHNLRKYFFSGLIVFLPLAMTVFLFIWILGFADGLLGRYIEPVFLREFGFYFKGLSLIITISLIFLCGFVVTNFLGKKLHALFENLLLRLPFFRQVYPAIKKIALFMFSKERLKFKQVVLVEYPRKGLYSLGFITHETNDLLGGAIKKKLCNIFIPTSPSPLTGFIILAPPEDVISTEMTIEEALIFIVSGGVMNPREQNSPGTGAV